MADSVVHRGQLRLFNAEFGTQIAWLLPSALVLAVVALVLLRRTGRTSPARATVLLFAGTVLVEGVAFSFGQGTIHSYYAVALAPGIGGLVGIGGWLLWTRREALWARVVAALVVLGAAALAIVLMSGSTGFLPWLPPVVGVLAVSAAAGILLLPAQQRLQSAAAVVGLAAMLAAPLAWSIDAVLTPQTGTTPSAGPQSADARGGGFPGGGANGQGFRGPGTAGGSAPGSGGPGGGAPGGGGSDGTTVSAALVTALRADASRYTWAAASVGSQGAATYQLQSGEAVMPIGGFTGSDPSPTLVQFEQDVTSGRIHYFIGGGSFGGRGGGSGSSAQITSWVESHYASSTIGGVTVYDLTAPTS